MPISLTTIKRLFARSRNRCAMPRCEAVLENGEHVVAEMCHIRARRKGGPRYDSALSIEEKDSFANLLLLCPTCHTLADKDRKTYTVEALARIKAAHEGTEPLELTPAVVAQAQRIFDRINVARTAKASARDRSIAAAIGGDNHAPITINQKNGGDRRAKGYPANSIGADANLANYIEYLCGVYVDYAAKMYPDEKDRWIRISTSIKQKFRLNPTSATGGRERLFSSGERAQVTAIQRPIFQNEL